MDWILSTFEGFDVFTDHHNLSFLFDPISVVADIFQT